MGYKKTEDDHTGKQYPTEEILLKIKQEMLAIQSPSLGGRHCGVQAVADILHALGDISTWDLQKLRQDHNKYVLSLERAILAQAEEIREKDKQIRKQKHIELLSKKRKKRKGGNR